MTGMEVDVDLPARGVRVALSVAPGETCALIGPNGAGKSSVLESVIGVLTPAAGQIRLSGRLLAGAGVQVPVHRRRVGWLAQRPLLFEHLSVRDNVAFGLVAAGRPRAQARARALDELDLVGARELAGRRPSQLSGGQAQRVAIARALAAEPDALLLDEPLAAIDVQGAAEIRQVLAERLRTLRLPVLLVTHDLIDLWRLADRVLVLSDGRIVESGAVADVLGRPRNQFLAHLGGRNLIAGVALEQDALQVGDLVVHGVSDTPLTRGDDTLALLDPAAIAVHLGRPEGSPRNVWPAVVTGVEPRGDAARLNCRAEGHPLAVDLTLAAVAELGLTPGLAVWLSVKASQVLLYPR
ncbi:MAG: ATP-binding cassette domain-containing protein [Micropruina sp.]|uniref:sulfate/molybdate ABC transporter ATP-binding protein n=1 Tax=Micropruina sp. TaxID=2737536 RepID=UPI0039E333C2